MNNFLLPPTSSTDQDLAELEAKSFFKDGSRAMEGSITMSGNRMIGPDTVELLNQAAGILPGAGRVSVYSKTVDKKLYFQDDTGLETKIEGGSVDGPVSSTDNALVRWDGTAGLLLKDGQILQDDSGGLSSINAIGSTGATGQFLLQTSLAASDAIRLNATNATAGIDIDSGLGGITMNTTGGLMVLDSSRNGAGAISLIASGVTGGIDFNAGGILSMSASLGSSQAMSISTLAPGGGLSINTDAGGIQLSSSTGQISLSSSFGGTDAIKLLTFFGGIDVGGGPNGVMIHSTGGQVQLESSLAASDSLRIHADDLGGGIDIDAGTGGITVNSTGGQIGLDGRAILITGGIGGVSIHTKDTSITVNSGEGKLSLLSDLGATDSLRLHASSVTGGIDVDSGTGGVDIHSTGGQIVIESTLAGLDSLRLHSSDAGGGIDIDSGTGSISINSTGGQIGLDARSIFLTGGVGGVSISSEDTSITVNSGEGKLSLFSSLGATDSLRLHASSVSGGIDIDSGTGGIAINSTGGQILFSSSSADPSSVKIQSTAGGIDLDGAALKSITLDSGTVQVRNKDAVAKSILLETNQGANETIAIDCVQGTDGGAIALTATAGGIDLEASSGKTLELDGGQVKLKSKDNTAKAIELLTNIGTSETIDIINTQGTGGSAIKIQAAAGNIDVDCLAFDLLASKPATEGTVNLSTIGSVTDKISLTAFTSTSVNAILLQSLDGGIEIEADPTKLVNIVNAPLNVQNEVRLQETGGGTDTTALKAPSVVTTSYTIVFPTDVGATNQIFRNTVAATTATLTWEDVPFSPGYIDVLEVEFKNVTTVTVSVGNARSDDDTFNIILASSTDAVITVSGAGGLDTGVEAGNTFYSVWVIGDSAGVNATDTLLSVSVSSPTLPAGYDKQRLVGWVRNNASSDFRQFSSSGIGRVRHIVNEVEEAELSIRDGAGSTTFVTESLAAFVPPGTKRHDMAIEFDMDSDTDKFFYRSGLNTFATVANTPRKVGQGISSATFGFDDMVLTNLSCNPATPNFQWASTVAGNDVELHSLGYYVEV